MRVDDRDRGIDRNRVQFDLVYCITAQGRKGEKEEEERIRRPRSGMR